MARSYTAKICKIYQKRIRIINVSTAILTKKPKSAAERNQEYRTRLKAKRETSVQIVTTLESHSSISGIRNDNPSILANIKTGTPDDNKQLMEPIDGNLVVKLENPLNLHDDLIKIENTTLQPYMEATTSGSDEIDSREVVNDQDPITENNLKYEVDPHQITAIDYLNSYLHRCCVCSQIYNSKSSLKSHLRSHPGQKKYQCDICEKVFAYEGILKIHKRTHTGDKPFKCNMCPKRFADRKNRRLHERIHTGERPYHCDQCERTFPRSDKLHRHKWVHTKERPHNCTVCGKGYIEKPDLVRHELSHAIGDPVPQAGSQFRCLRCNMDFREIGDLAKHQAAVHRPKHPFKCDVCVKSFAQIGRLERHQLLHNKFANLVTCEVCFKSFTELYRLVTHQRKAHTSTKRYTCEVCPKSFVKLASLKKHQRTHTGEQTY